MNQELDRLTQAAQQDNEETFCQALNDLWARARDTTDTTRLSTLVAKLAGHFPGLPTHWGSRLGMVCGALVERGATPTPLVAPIAAGVHAALTDTRLLIETWTAEQEAPPLPDPTDDHDKQSGYQRLLDLMEQRAAEAAIMAWYELDTWKCSAQTLLQFRTIRDQWPDRTDLAQQVSFVNEYHGGLGFLLSLLAVLDDEPLTVVHRETHTGFRLRISGIGDNFQLHTLIAAAVTGSESEGFLSGPSPTESEILAATDGPPEAEMHGYFNLVDLTGKWIWNEGYPADIPVMNGQRVIVLDPPPYARSWNIGRSFPHMQPTCILEHILPDDEARQWITQATQTADINTEHHT